MSDLIEIRRLNSAVVVIFRSAALMNSGELDRVRQVLYAEIEVSRLSMLLDFTTVEYVSSQAIGLLLGLTKKLAQIDGASLSLCCLAPRLRELLKLTRIDHLVKIYDNREDARDAIREMNAD